MPVVARPQRQVSQVELRGGQMQAAETAASEGAGVEQAKQDKAQAFAQFGGAVERVGTDLFARIQEQERVSADQTALLKANNQLSEWKNRRLYDPNAGAFTLKGEAALPLPEQLKGEFDDVAGSIEASLGSARQKAAFANLRSQEWQGIDLQVRRHVFGEMQTFRATELKGTVDNAINDAIQNALDPKLSSASLAKAVSAVQTSGPGLGLGKEAIDQQVSAIQSQVHVGIISSLLAQEKDSAAKAYWDATKGQIAGDKQDAVLRALEEGGNRAESQKKADDIIAKGGTLTEQRAAAREITDPKVRDLVEQRIEHNDAVNDKIARETEATQMRQGFDILDKNPDVSKIPPDLWTSYSGSTRSALKEYAHKRLVGEPIETDLPTYYARMQEAGNNPTAFVNRNLLEDRARLGETEFKQLAALQLSIKNADTKASEKELAPFRTKQQLLDDTLSLHGIDPNAKPDTAVGRSIAQLRRMVDVRVEVLQGGGKKASDQDIQAEIDKLLSQKETVPGSWWNIFPGGKSFTDTEKRLIDLTVDDIPASERPLLEQALRSRGRAVSDATVLDLYLEAKARGVKK